MSATYSRLSKRCLHFLLNVSSFLIVLRKQISSLICDLFCVKEHTLYDFDPWKLLLAHYMVKPFLKMFSMCLERMPILQLLEVGFYLPTKSS